IDEKVNIPTSRVGRLWTVHIVDGVQFGEPAAEPRNVRRDIGRSSGTIESPKKPHQHAFDLWRAKTDNVVVAEPEYLLKFRFVHGFGEVHTVVIKKPRELLIDNAGYSVRSGG